MHILLTLHNLYHTSNVFRSAFDKISGDLNQKVDALTSDLKTLSVSVATSHGTTSAPPSPISSTSSEIPLFSLLSSSTLLPCLDPNDYKNTVHWGPKRYRKLRRKAAEKGKGTAKDDLEVIEIDSPSPESNPELKEGSVLSCYLEDRDGNVIPESEKKAILAMASAFWKYLWDKDKAPATFRKVNLEVKIQWQMLMESNFKCLRYCDNHWKVDQVWINNYPSWLSNTRRAAKLAEQKELKMKAEAEDAVINTDAKNNVNEDDENNEDEDNDSEDNGDEGDDEDVGEASKSKRNKRGPPDNGDGNKSKRARVEEPEKSAPPPRHIPSNITTKRARVCTVYFVAICIINNL